MQVRHGIMVYIRYLGVISARLTNGGGHFLLQDKDFPELLGSVWEEHFLHLAQPPKNPAKARPATAVVLLTGGPYEGLARDALWQDEAMRLISRLGVGFFYDGLNPRSGIGGESPLGSGARASRTYNGRPVNNTGGLLRDDWHTLWARKAKLLAAARGTRLASLYASPPPPPPPPPARRSPPPPTVRLVGLDASARTAEQPGGTPPRGDGFHLSGAAALLVLLVVVGQLGYLRRLGSARAVVDRAAPRALLPLLGWLWELLGVPPVDTAGYGRASLAAPGPGPGAIGAAVGAAPRPRPRGFGTPRGRAVRAAEMAAERGEAGAPDAESPSVSSVSSAADSGDDRGGAKQGQMQGRGRAREELRASLAEDSQSTVSGLVRHNVVRLQDEAHAKTAREALTASLRATRALHSID